MRLSPKLTLKCAGGDRKVDRGGNHLQLCSQTFPRCLWHAPDATTFRLQATFWHNSCHNAARKTPGMPCVVPGQPQIHALVPSTTSQLAFPASWSHAICTVLLDPQDPLLQSERTQGFAADPVYGRAKCLPMLGSLKTSRT